MSAIVNDAKPFVLPLIAGEDHRLSPEGQRKLATWIATAVIISEFEDKAFVTIPQHHRDWLSTTSSAPADWKIWIGDYSRNRWKPEWLHQRFCVTGPDQPPPGPREEGPLNTQTTSYVIGKLFIHVLSSAVSGGALNWKFADEDRRLLRQIIPGSDFGIKWPPPSMNDRDADRISGALMEQALRVVGLPPARELLKIERYKKN